MNASEKTAPRQLAMPTRHKLWAYTDHSNIQFSKMRTGLPILAIITLTFLHLCTGVTHAQDADSSALQVPVALAQHIAAEHVQANNRPFQWRAVDHMVLYDLTGHPNGYAFIFSKADSRFNGPIALRQHIIDRATSSASQGEQAVSSSDNDLFAFQDLATVITGATTDSPLILRHFRGAPEFWVEAIKQDTSRQGGTEGMTRVVMVTPMDFRLVTTSGIATAAATSGQAEVIRLAASDQTITIRSEKSENISELRQQAQDREARDRQRVQSMTPEEKQREEAAQNEREAFLRAQWGSKRAVWEALKDSQQ